MTEAAPDLKAVTQIQQKVWSEGDFAKIGNRAQIVGEHLCETVDVLSVERVLDVACGSGNAALAAARRFAEAVGVDYVPELLAHGRERAAAEGLEVEFVEGDAQALPFDDASFDVVLSTFGAMFAPDHGAVARELARVTRQGGRIGLITWNPEGGIGELFRLLGSFQPPPPEGAGNPLDWGREEHARNLLEDDFELRFVRGTNLQTGASGEEMWQLAVTSFGPMKTLYESLDEERREELHKAYVDFSESHSTNGHVEAPREYLIILGTRR